MPEPTIFDQLFGQQTAASNDVASQLFGEPVSTNSVASQLFNDNNGIDNDEDPEVDDGIEPDEDTNEFDEPEEDEDNGQESVLSQLFGSEETGADVANQLFGENADSSVEDQLFGDTSTNEHSVHDQLFGGPTEFVEGGLEGPSPEMVIAMLSSLLIPKPVSGTGNVNITFQGPVTFNL